MPAFKIEEVFSYTTSLLYALITDVEQYPSFLPWCLGAKILEKKEQELIADLIIGAGPFRDTFRSCVLLTPFSKVEVLYKKGQGPLKHLKNVWELRETQGGTMISFEVDFVLQNPFLNKMMEATFPKATEKMMEAFKKRAEELSKK